MFDVITFGSATRDAFLRSSALELHNDNGVIDACFTFGAKLNVEEMTLETGGGGTNNAVTFSRLAKLKTAAVIRIGKDSTGDEIIKALKNDRVSTALVQKSERFLTGYSTILLSNEAERTILTHRGASAHIDSRLIPWNTIKAKLFHISSLGGDLELLTKIIARAKKIGAKVYFNPGNSELGYGLKTLMPLLNQLDILFLNKDEATTLIGKKTSNLRTVLGSVGKITPHTVVTDGRNGAYSVSAKEILSAEILPSPRINQTGAGDAFCSAYAAGFLLYHDHKTALALGTLNATNVVQHMGAKVGILHSMPSKKEIKIVKIKKINL